MTKEQSFFIQILSDYMNGRKTDDAEVNWNIIYQYSREHQMSGLIYAQASNCMPQENLDCFRKDMLFTLFFASNREKEFLTIKKVFLDVGILFFIVKGPTIAELYPVPELRAMGDIDMVVRRDDREKCHDIMLQRGYKCVSNQEDREWQYYKNHMEFEIHDRLVYKESVNEKGQADFFNNCWEYVKDGQLDCNFHLLFLIFHLRKHLMNSGVGFRQFMDLAVFAQKNEIDWAWMEANLKKTDMFEFACRCYGFIYRWFGIKIPLMEEIDDDFFEQATEKIFADGIFGFQNVENMDNVVFNQIRNKKYPKLGMIKIAACYVFPSCNKLKNDKTYSYLQKYPVLLPAAWVHRLVRWKKKRKEKAFSLGIKKTFISNESIAKRRLLLQKWGL